MRFNPLALWQERVWPPPRQDGAALGFGVAFLVFGGAGLARSLGLHFDSVWLYPLGFLCLGTAGLLSLLLRRKSY